MASSGELPSRKNIVIFGETGSGKSSVTNMLLGRTAATVSDSAVGCTFEFTKYEYQNYNIFDTVGLSEGSSGLVTSSKAISGLVRLLKTLQDGVNLLILVMRKDRIKKTLEDNYKLFVDIICMNKVPVILVITHCEQDQDMGEWWRNNKQNFTNYGMVFKDAVSVCATRGEGMLPLFAEVLKARYDESRIQLLNSIERYVMSIGWRMKTWTQWFQTILKRVMNFFLDLFRWPRIPYSEELKNLLMKVGMDERTAIETANHIIDTV